MAKLTRRGGIYYADLRAEGGKRVSLHTRDKVVAKERLRELELADANPARHSTETLRQALEHLLDVAMVGRPAGTLQSYRTKARWLITVLGTDTLLRELSRDRVHEYVRTRLAHASRSTVHKELVVLRRALAEARDRGLWSGDIAQLVPTFSGTSTPRDRWLTELEYTRLLAQLRPLRQLWVVLAVQTGARVGELEGTEEHAGISWSDVDLETGWVRIPGKKTRGSWRRVPISAELRVWLGTVPREARSGMVLTPWPNYRRDLAAACRRIGRAERREIVKGGSTPEAAAMAAPAIAPVSANDLRRTFASWLLQAGVNPLTVARLLGHGSTRMVERIYGQLGLDTYQRAIDALPSCAVCVPEALGRIDTYETHETAPQREPKRKTAGETEISGGFAVPRDRIELPTRGFSVRELRVISGGKSRK